MPDGRILYTVGAAGTSDVFVVNADGTNARQLTSNAAINGFPTVTADGRYIVFVSTRWRSASLADGRRRQQSQAAHERYRRDKSQDLAWPDSGFFTRT